MTEVLAPVTGTVKPMSDVPDAVFSAEMVGSGVAIDPQTGEADAVSPIAGTLVKVHPHAFVVVGDDGTGVLVHLGINTVRLGGEGFEVIAEEKSRVEAGQPVTRWDPADIVGKGLSPVVVVCVMDSQPGAVSSDQVGAAVNAGDALFAWPQA